MSANFAILGVGGFVAPRHLKAIRDTGNELVAACDPHDAVGLLDRFSFNVRFFTEYERFDRHLEKLRRGPDDQRVHYVSVCSPNYLHDAHVRLALRVGATAICEKPLVIRPWNLDALQALESEYGTRVYTVLQLRLHPQLLALRERLARETPARRHTVELTYITSRGPWYDISWKGVEERSGGVVTNIGIHFFDMLLWLFGPERRSDVHVREARRAAGVMELERADVRWFLSTDRADLPDGLRAGQTTFRSVTVDGSEIEFSDGFDDLHTRVYQETLAGRGFGIDDARPSLELVHRIRHADITTRHADPHPMVAGKAVAGKAVAGKAGSPAVSDYFVHESSYVDADCTIGPGTKIWHFSHVMSGSQIGPGCNIGQNVVISPGVTIGANVKIQNNVSVYTGVVLEDDVFCGPSMVFTNVVNPRSHVSRKSEYLQTLVRRGATLGANSTIVCGHTVGRYAFVGAGAVITRDVADYALVVGNPGRIAGWMCECGVKLSAGSSVPAKATCRSCGASYVGADGVLTRHVLSLDPS